MTAINFPDNPQIGDAFLNFAWDGEKWRNTGSRASALVVKDLFEFSVAADDSTQRTISTGESIKFTGAGTVTTASDAEGNITITGAATNLTGYATETFVTSRGYLTSVGTISYNDLSNKPTLFDGAYSSLSGRPTLFSGSYNDLTDKPNLAGTYTFNVAADDSTLRTISSEETVKFIGAGGITTASDTEGAITITQGAAAAGTLTGSTLASGVTASSLTSVGTLTSLSSGAITTTGTLAVNASGGITTNQTTFLLINSSATTVTAFGAATTINLGYTNSVAFSNTFNIATNAQAFSTKTVNIGTGSSADGSTYVNIGSTLGQSYVTVNGTLTATLSGNASTATKLATARAINGVNFDGSAAITVTADASTLSGSTLASGVTASSLTSVGTLTGVTSNAATAFIAGTAAESGVALQMPREGALRNLTNGANSMYFDVSIGGSTHGQFQFRSSSSFTNVLTMSPTAFNVNPDAVVTARTPSFGRLPWNSAIDTELSIDNYRFRVSNQGGNFPQIISNTGGTVNTAWTAVAARSSSAITQTGSTGILLPYNSWTSLYTSAGMDNSGDTVTVTLQNKSAGKIYRVTFMRSDDGSVGYNIIAERIL